MRIPLGVGGDKYNLENLISTLSDPGSIPDAMEHVYRDSRNAARDRFERKWFGRQYSGEQEDIIEKDWDNLLLLDACRYDTLRSVYGDDVERVVSVAGESSGFIDRTMNGKDLTDTVYVSSNPYTDITLEDGVFHEVVRTYAGTWDASGENDHTKFHPRNVSEIARDTIDRHDRKRFVVHFMQPHGPYFGERAQQLRRELVAEEDIAFTRMGVEADSSVREYPDLLYAAKDGYLTPEQLRDVYRENLEFVLTYALELAESMEGKTVISADHGERLGSPASRLTPKYGHGGWAPEVMEVPWFELEHDGRKEVTRSTPVDSARADSDTVMEQLEHLGYA